MGDGGERGVGGEGDGGGVGNRWEKTGQGDTLGEGKTGRGKAGCRYSSGGRGVGQGALGAFRF